jgi:tRNA nucleotidyltransferase/poly(A) polymerase
MMAAEAAMSPELIQELAGLAHEAGARVYLVGGYVRDRLLGREPVDLDLLVEGDPARFLTALSQRAAFEPVVFSRKEPVTYRVALKDWLVDVSGFPAGSLEAELRRRDMTLNALAVPLEHPDAPPVDPAGGVRDIRDRRIRHVSEQGLREDPLRLLRAVRLAVVLEDFTLDDSLRRAIAALAPRIREAPAERVLAELEVILASPRAGQGVRLMHDVGLLFHVFPELAALEGLRQNRWHSHDALEHTLRAVQEADGLQGDPSAVPGSGPPEAEEWEILKWAALWHDAGKPATATRSEDGEVHFHGHENVSATLAAGALARLRVSGRRAERVVALVANHLRLTLLAAGDEPADRALRRLIHQVKYDIPLLCLLAIADRRAGGGPDAERRLAALLALIDRVLKLFQAESDRLITPQALLSGHDVMAILQIGPGPRVGTVLRWLTRLQVEGRLKDRDEAVELLRTMPAARLLTLDDEP